MSRDSAPMRTILLLFALVNLMGMPFTVLMPMFASKVLHGGPHTLGFLMGASGHGRPGGGFIAGGAQKRARAYEDDSHFGGAVWRGADSFRVVAVAVDLLGHDAADRLWHDAGHGGEQHHHPDDCERR